MKTKDTANRFKEETMLDAQGNTAGKTYENIYGAAANESGNWKREAIAGSAGILLGAAGAYAATSLIPKTQEEETADDGVPNDDGASSENVSISIVNRDNLSFTDAFALARHEVGTAGAFEWHGKLYSTFTADEWDNMSGEERNTYYSRIDWKPSDNAERYIARAESHGETSHPDTPDNLYNTSEERASAADNHREVTADNAHAEERHIPEVEVLGVVHDGDMDMNIGGMLIDGQEVVVVDVDKDNTFDYAMSDLNHDGELQENEIADISGRHVTVEDLGGFIDTGDGIYAGNDGNMADDVFTEDL